MNSPDLNKLETLPEMTSTCPPALRCLVFLWEQINANCIQVLQGNALNNDVDQNGKESNLMDDQNVDDFDVRKSDTKKGKKFTKISCRYTFSNK